MNDQMETQSTNAANNAAAPKANFFAKFNFNLQSKSFIRSAVLLALSLILLIFAFCPIVSYKSRLYIFNWDEGEYLDYKMSAGVGATKNIGNVFNAMRSQSDKRLSKSDIADDIEDLVEDISDEKADMLEDEKVTKEYRKLTKQYVNLMNKVILRSEDVGPSLDSYISLILSFALIVAAIVFFAAAALNFYYEITGTESIANISILSRETLNKISTMLLAAIPGLMIILFGLLYMGFGPNNAYALTGIFLSPRISFTAFLAIILSLGALVALLVERVQAKEVVIDEKAKKHIVSAVIALITICIIFAPIASFKIDGDLTVTEKKAKITIHNDIYQGLRMGKYSYLAMDANAIGYTAQSAIGPSLDIYDEDADVAKAVATVFVMIFDIMLIIATFVLISSLVQLIYGKGSLIAQLIARIVGLVIALPAAGMNLIFGIACTESSGDVRGMIGIAPFLYVVLAVLSLIFMVKSNKPQDQQPTYIIVNGDQVNNTANINQ